MPMMKNETIEQFDDRLRAEHAQRATDADANLPAKYWSAERMAAFKRELGIGGSHPQPPHRPANLPTEMRRRHQSEAAEQRIQTVHFSDLSADERRQLARRLGVTTIRSR